MSAVLILLGTAIYVETITVKIRKVVQVAVVKNKDNIKSVHQLRHPLFDKNFYIDQINFQTDGTKLMHASLGDMGYDEDYFVDFKALFTVKRTSNYQFQIGSDDGFALYIDGQLICQYAGLRSYAKTTCGKVLTIGSHQLKLNYFQSNGKVGLSAKYKNAHDRGLAFIGSDTNFIAFLPYHDDE